MSLTFWVEQIMNVEMITPVNKVYENNVWRTKKNKPELIPIIILLSVFSEAPSTIHCSLFCSLNEQCLTAVYEKESKKCYEYGCIMPCSSQSSCKEANDVLLEKVAFSKSSLSLIDLLYHCQD